MKRTLCSALVASVFTASLAFAADPAAPLSGVDTTSVDANVRAQDDFFRYSQGSWLKNVAIPADRSAWGAFNIAQENVQEQLRTIIEEADAAGKGKPGSDAQKVGDYYASFMDEARRNSLGLAPLKAELAAIAALKDKQGIAALIAHFNAIGATAPFAIAIHQDNKDSTQYIADINQSGLGMPNRDYYLKLDDAKMGETRAKYLVHLENMLKLAGHADAANEARQILEFETGIAKAHWTAVENRDPVKGYNKLSIAELSALAPGLDWNAYLKGAGMAGKAQALNVSQPSYLSGLDALIKATPLPALKAYFELRLVSSYAPFLSQSFVDESFAFRGKVLSGAPVNRSLQKRAISAVDNGLGEVVGKVYVQKYFPAERKAQVETMVRNFLAAFKQGIETLDWMTPATKAQAQVKLSKISVKVGYPNKWRDYATLTIARDDLVGNVIRSREFEHAFEVAKLGHPIDREEWGMTPQTVNAYYSPEMNEIVFPAARLQAPLYDANAEPAINYGAVGISIGHEISHAFDDQGAQYDGDGNLRNWWTKEDAEKFAARGKMLVAQYNGYSPVPGYTINGELTLGENIADNAGAIMALRAYRLSLGGKAAPVIDGWTAEQRLFMGMAQARRGKAREPALIAQIKSDPHSPAEFRVNGSVKNHPGFYDAFGVKQGDLMYLAPEQRVIFW
ncbi:MAG: M13 family metallopeptidase [Pseudomonadota bacterium]